MFLSYSFILAFFGLSAGVKQHQCVYPFILHLENNSQPSPQLTFDLSLLGCSSNLIGHYSGCCLLDSDILVPPPGFYYFVATSPWIVITQLYNGLP